MSDDFLLAQEVNERKPIGASLNPLVHRVRYLPLDRHVFGTMMRPQ